MDWQNIIETIYKQCKSIRSGKNAAYIPELKHVNPHLYAISVCTVDGDSYNIGDYKTSVAIESVSKIFTLSLALQEKGVKHILEKIGNQKSRAAFDSVVAVESSKIHTLNSFDNAGAMATTSLSYVPRRTSFQKKIYDTMSRFAGRTLSMSRPIYESEMSHSDHNHALAYLLHSYGRFYAPIEPTVDVYTRQCSAMVTSQDVATMAATLANKGVNPKTGIRAARKKEVDYILQHMLDHGLYDESDTWIQHVGQFPAKSGVGGVILMVVPGVAGIGIVSPPLDKSGNSVKGFCSAKTLASFLP